MRILIFLIALCQCEDELSKHAGLPLSFEGLKSILERNEGDFVREFFKRSNKDDQIKAERKQRKSYNPWSYWVGETDTGARALQSFILENAENNKIWPLAAVLEYRICHKTLVENCRNLMKSKKQPQKLFKFGYSTPQRPKRKRKTIYNAQLEIEETVDGEISSMELTRKHPRVPLALSVSADCPAAGEPHCSTASQLGEVLKEAFGTKEIDEEGVKEVILPEEPAQDPTEEQITCRRLFTKIKPPRESLSDLIDHRGQLSTMTYSPETNEMILEHLANGERPASVQRILKSFSTYLKCTEQDGLDIPSSSYIYTLMDSIPYLLNERAKSYVEEAEHLYLMIDGTTSHRNSPIIALVLNNENGTPFVFSIFQSVKHDGQTISKRIWEELKKFVNFDGLARKIMFISSDTAASQVKANELLRNKFVEAGYEKPSVMRCQMHAVQNFDKFSSFHWNGVREMDKIDKQDKPAALLIALKLSFGARVLTTHSQADIKFQLLATMHDNYDDLSERQTNFFNTDKGSRFNVNSSNMKSFLIYFDAVMSTVRQFPTKKYAKKIVDIVDSPNGNEIVVQTSGVFLMWEALIEPFWNAMRAQTITFGKGKRTYKAARQKLEFVTSGEHAQNFDDAQFPESSFSRLMRVAQSSIAKKKNDDSEAEFCEERAFEILQKFFDTLDEEARNRLDKDLQRSLQDIWTKFKKEEEEFTKMDLPDGFSLVATNSIVEGLFSHYKMFEIGDYSSSNAHLAIKARAKHSKLVDWIKKNTEKEKLLWAALRSRRAEAQKQKECRHEELMAFLPPKFCPPATGNARQVRSLNEHCRYPAAEEEKKQSNDKEDSEKNNQEEEKFQDEKNSTTTVLSETTTTTGRTTTLAETADFTPTSDEKANCDFNPEDFIQSFNTTFGMDGAKETVSKLAEEGMSLSSMFSQLTSFMTEINDWFGPGKKLEMAKLALEALRIWIDFSRPKIKKCPKIMPPKYVTGSSPRSCHKFKSIEIDFGEEISRITWWMRQKTINSPEMAMSKRFSSEQVCELRDDLFSPELFTNGENCEESATALKIGVDEGRLKLLDIIYDNSAKKIVFEMLIKHHFKTKCQYYKDSAKKYYSKNATEQKKLWHEPYIVDLSRDGKAIFNEGTEWKAPTITTTTQITTTTTQITTTTTQTMTTTTTTFTTMPTTIARTIRREMASQKPTVMTLTSMTTSTSMLDKQQSTSQIQTETKATTMSTTVSSPTVIEATISDGLRLDDETADRSILLESPGEKIVYPIEDRGLCLEDGQFFKIGFSPLEKNTQVISFSSDVTSSTPDFSFDVKFVMGTKVIFYFHAFLDGKSTTKRHEIAVKRDFGDADNYLVKIWITGEVMLIGTIQYVETIDDGDPVFDVIHLGLSSVWTEKYPAFYTRENGDYSLILRELNFSGCRGIATDVDPSKPNTNYTKPTGFETEDGIKVLTSIMRKRRFTWESFRLKLQFMIDVFHKNNMETNEILSIEDADNAFKIMIVSCSFESIISVPNSNELQRKWALNQKMTIEFELSLNRHHQRLRCELEAPDADLRKSPFFTIEMVKNKRRKKVEFTLGQNDDIYCKKTAVFNPSLHQSYEKQQISNHNFVFFAENESDDINMHYK